MSGLVYKTPIAQMWVLKFMLVFVFIIFYKANVLFLCEQSVVFLKKIN